MFYPVASGAFPRFPNPPRPRFLEQAIQDYGQGKIEDKDLRKAMERAEVETIAEMISAGIEIVSDVNIRLGQTPQEICTEYISQLTDFEIEGEGDNRRVVIDDRIDVKRPVKVNSFKFLYDRSPVELRPVLMGMLSLAHYSELKYYDDDLDVAACDFARALNREIEGLTAAGANHILIFEPLLTHSREYGEIFLKASQILLMGVEAKVMLGTWGDDVVGLAEKLNESDYAGICFDMVNGKGNEVVLSEGGLWNEKIVELNLLSNNPEHIESAMEIAVQLIKYSEYQNPSLIWAGIGNDIVSLDRSIVFQKMNQMCTGVDWARKEMIRRESPSGKINT